MPVGACLCSTHSAFQTTHLSDTNQMAIEWERMGWDFRLEKSSWFKTDGELFSESLEI